MKPLSITAQVARLPSLKLDELKALWQQLFGTPARFGNRPFLERRIAYRLQEDAYRIKKPALLEYNRQRIAAVQQQEASAGTRANRLMPGTVLTRVHNGVKHRVTSLPDGQYEWQGKPYRSLSVIAREITGTRWSGPAFFGLKGGAR